MSFVQFLPRTVLTALGLNTALTAVDADAIAAQNLANADQTAAAAAQTTANSAVTAAAAAQTTANSASTAAAAAQTTANTAVTAAAAAQATANAAIPQSQLGVAGGVPTTDPGTNIILPKFLPASSSGAVGNISGSRSAFSPWSWTRQETSATMTDVSGNPLWMRSYPSLTSGASSGYGSYATVPLTTTSATTPFTVIGRVRRQMQVQGTISGGILLYDTVKAIPLTFTHGGKSISGSTSTVAPKQNTLTTQKWSSQTGPGTIPFAMPIDPWDYYLKIQSDGTNIICSFSKDGSWYSPHSTFTIASATSGYFNAAGFCAICTIEAGGTSGVNTAQPIDVGLVDWSISYP